MFGFLNVYKPKGMTSHDVVAVLRRITKIKQIGHTGTLDPFAEGVLPICIGKATRLIEYLKDDKAYLGTIQLGKSTSTYDIEGDLLNVSEKKITRREFESILPVFRGNISQIPPIFSAIKVNGKKLYEYARKGQEVSIEPRKVFIKKLEIVGFNEEEQTAEVLIECSKGTYIRSIANDIGEALGCFGHLIKLVRVKAGDFKIEDSIKLEYLQSMEDVEKSLAYPLKYLSYPIYELNEVEKEKVSHGNAIPINKECDIFILVYQNKIVAVAKNENKKARILKVFI